MKSVPTPTDRPFRIGVDIGGTFTDAILLDAEGKSVIVGKTLTTPDDPSRGVEATVGELLARGKVRADQVRDIIHGTTLVTNAIIERRGVKTALLVTAGFRDILEMGRERRYDMDDLFLEMPEPLVPRHLRFEVRERILADGAVETLPDRQQISEIAQALVRQGVRAAAICFLHSYKNPTNERSVAEWLKESVPGLYVSLSSEVIPEIREYERMSTTVANAYVQPVMERYVRKLDGRLRAVGFRGNLYLMLSSGGICTPDVACRFPIRLLESGPAAGVLAAAHFGKLTAEPNVLSFDMGGTTAKLCIIDRGEPLTTLDFETARVYRFKKGSGMPIRGRVVDMIEIGAGGGSIARVDQLGLLKIGPDSAEADPGPVCYGSGGQEPTVTDADLILGYLDPDFFLGGRMKLDRGAAQRAIEGRLALPLGVGADNVAWGIHQIVNEGMANAARVHAIEKGKDPRSYVLFAFGGAGPAHAYRVAELLGISSVMIPPGAGVASAFGFLCAPLAFDFVRTYRSSLRDMDWGRASSLLVEMEEEGTRLLLASGVAEEEIRLERRCDMRYVGQAHELEVVIPGGPLAGDRSPEVRQLFEEEYRRHFGRTCLNVDVEVINWRVLASGPRPCPDVRELGVDRSGHSVGQPLKGYRRAYFPESRGYEDTPVYDRYRLEPGDVIKGPAIIEERESTTVVGPGGDATVDNYLNLIIRRRES